MAKEERVRLVIERVSNKTHFALLWGPHNPERWKLDKGRFRSVELTTEESFLKLTDVIVMYRQGKLKAQNGVPPDAPTEQEKLLVQAEEKKAKLLPILEGIIKTSNQDGEVYSAKVQWKKLTGRDYGKTP